ncbi:hypothetical protein SEA_CRATER_55 [Gordonia phage Crater]|uniref:Uncharacterized protein n=1 Tax=Gordonia phage Apricot TaxID=2250319 RepID=A0A345L162_9CAUD|nr:hypothetical protein HOT72_gp055 [Gordonia phage Apricot]AXH49014.1 hypothetical protein SEA_APRICOT_55 [Gordonia phage Apricot]WNM69807.1 hypothetical protein SEA_CRATER_55 [Gordonia phage Crater]
MRTVDEVRTLIGDKLPGGGVPASWWITTDAEVLRLFDEWSTAEFEYQNRVANLGEELGCERWMCSGHGGSLMGFVPPTGMGTWESHPEFKPVPTGWRIDSKTRYLVPGRRTKADRESAANKRFADLKHAPQLSTPGMPQELWLPGAVYGVSIRRGEACVMAFCGGDPDRAESRREFEVDESIWERLPLSTFHLLREEVPA